MIQLEQTRALEPALSPILDHVIVVVADLDRAARAYEALGFTVSPASVHPFGTTNRLVIFQHNFIELLAVHDAGTLGHFQVVTDFLVARGENGAWGIIWRADFPEPLHATLENAGLEPSNLQERIERDVMLPDGRVETACFSSFALRCGNTPTYLEGFSHQHNPAAVFVADWQRHANGACDITLVAMSTNDLEPAQERWSRVFGRCLQSHAEELVLAGKSDEVRLTKRGDRGACPTGPMIEEVTISVGSIPVVERLIGDRATQRGAGWLMVAGDHELGVRIVFREVGGSE